MAEKVQPKCPVPPIPPSACTAKQSKKRKTFLEKATTKKRLDKARCQTRVNIGVAFQRWRQLRELKGLKSDAMVAVFLLDSYEKDSSTSTPSKHGLTRPPPAVSTIFAESFSNRYERNHTASTPSKHTAFPPPPLLDCDRSGGALPNPLPNLDPQSEDMPSNAECVGKPPFEVTMASRGTGTILERAVSPDGSDPFVPEVVAVIDEESGSSDGGEEVSGEGDMDSSDSDWDPSVDHNFLSEERMDKDSDNDEQNLNNSPVGYKHRQLCPECGRFFNNIKPHTCEYKIKPYPCNICGKRCVSEHYLNLHRRIHKEDYVHQCKFCLATFKTRLDKLAHEDAHPSSHKPYQCPDCSETFSNIRVRNKHVQGHIDPNRHNCHVCNMEFHSLSQLQRHMVVHTGVKQFVCQVCQRSFNQASHLKSHMRLHTGERPFKCLHCDKSFNHNVSLKSHVQRYHNQVPDFESKQLMEKKNSNKSEAEKDEMNEKESNTDDVEDREGSKKDSTPEFNNLEEEEEEEGEEEEEEEEEEENEDTRTTIKTKKRSTGRPKGRPKRNAGVRGVNLVFAVQAETQCQKTEAETCEMDQLNRTSCGSDESKGGQSDSYSSFNPTKNKRRKKMNSGRGRGRPKTSEVEEYDSDSDFDPAEKRKKKKSGDQNLKSTGRGRGRPKKNSVV
ncbi:uncharacterized protein ACJ7VT_017695 [Polymixia lowei]